jgi:alpha-L-fucosidase
VGQWLQTLGTSIYRTRGGPVSPRQWGVTTQRGDTVFVHVLSWQDRVLALPDLGARVLHAAMLGSEAPVAFTPTPAGVTLTLPVDSTATPDRIVVLVTSARSHRLAPSPKGR